MREQEAEIQQIDAGIRAMESDVGMSASGSRGSLRSVAHHARKAHPDVQKLTMKQLVVRTLTEHLKNGATANELLDFFERKWGRKIERTSLSPQLSRLKSDNIIQLQGKTWRLSEPARAFGVPGLFPNEIGEALASPVASDAPTSGFGSTPSSERAS